MKDRGMVVGRSEKGEVVVSMLELVGVEERGEGIDAKGCCEDEDDEVKLEGLLFASDVDGIALMIRSKGVSPVTPFPAA